MNDTAKIGFVFCVESGSLEAQTAVLVRSFREFGGRFRNAPLVAVTPRRGPALARTTRNIFRTHGVEHIRVAGDRDYSWCNFYNKPVALVAAEKYLNTGTIGWLDSDLLIVNEPDQLVLTADEDFLAFPVECKEMGTSGPGDPYEGLWSAACRVVGIDIQSLPWIETAQTRERVRLYFNSGLFVYRRGSGLSQEYLRLCRALLDARMVPDAENFGVGFNEMAALGFAALNLRFKWRALSYSHNYAMSKSTHELWYSAEALRDAKIVHYHDSMWPPFWDTFLACMQDAHPRAAEMLRSIGAMNNAAMPHARLIGKMLRVERQRRQRQYLASCTKCSIATAAGFKRANLPPRPMVPQARPRPAG